MAETPGGEIIVYEAPDGSVQVDVRLERETVWLPLTQMAVLFGRDKSLISKHLRNVFRSGDLEREAIVAEKATVQQGSGREGVRKIEFFNPVATSGSAARLSSLPKPRTIRSLST